MPACCSVMFCNSRGLKDSVNFYRIPSILHFKHKEQLNSLSKIRRQKWLDAIERQDLTEPKIKYALVCGKHFVSGKPAPLVDCTSPDWVPTLHMKDEISVHKSNAETKLCKRVTFPETKEDSPEKTTRNPALNKEHDQDKIFDQPASPESHSDSETLSCSGDDMLGDVIDDSTRNLNSAASHTPNKASEMSKGISKCTNNSNSENQSDHGPIDIDNDLTECHTCVCCLYPNASTNIFQGVYESSIITGGLSEVPLSQIFSSLTGIEAQEDSTFEHVLCDECLELMTSFYDFKLKVMHSYMYLLQQNSKSTNEQSKHVDKQKNINEIDLIEASDDIDNCDDSLTNQIYQSYDDPESLNALENLGEVPENIKERDNADTMEVSTEIGVNEDLLLERETWDNFTNEITQNIYINLETNEQIDVEEVSKLTDLKNIIRLDVALPNEVIENLEIYSPNNKVQTATNEVSPQEHAEHVEGEEHNGRNTETVLPPKRQKLLPGSNIVLTQKNGQYTLSPKRPIAKLQPSTKFKSKFP